MKIIVSGYHNPHFLTITEYMERAIKALGHDLIIYDDRQHPVPGSVRRRVKWLESIDSRHINKKLVLLVQATFPDLLIVTGGHRIKADTVTTIKKMNIPTVLWTIDPPSNFQPIIDAAPRYDYIFCQGTEANELLAKAGITGSHWLPMACDPFYHHPVEVSEQEKKRYGNDLVFVGSFYPNRAELLERLTKFDLGLWGPGWDQLSSESSLRKHVRGLQVTPDIWRKIYCASSIMLTPHYQDVNNRFPVYQASPKIFEAMACGAFVMSDNQKDVFKLFKKGVHLEVFYNLEDLKEKLSYYLNHPEERMKIAKQGRQEVITNHTYVKRIEKLFSIIHNDE